MMTAHPSTIHPPQPRFIRPFASSVQLQLELELELELRRWDGNLLSARTAQPHTIGAAGNQTQTQTQTRKLTLTLALTCPETLFSNYAEVILEPSDPPRNNKVTRPTERLTQPLLTHSVRRLISICISMIPHDRHIPMPDWTPECGDNAVALRLCPLLFLPRASHSPPANFSPKAFARSVRFMTGYPKVPRLNGHEGHPLLFTMLPCAGWVPGNKTKRPLAQPCGRGRGGMAIAPCKAPIRTGPFFYDLLATLPLNAGASSTTYRVSN